MNYEEILDILKNHIDSEYKVEYIKMKIVGTL